MVDVKPAAAGPVVNGDDPRQVDLAEEDPLVQRANAQHTPPTPVGWARRRERRQPSRLRQKTPNKCGLALAALRPMVLSMNTDPTNPPSPNKFLPQPPVGGHAPRTPAIHQRQRRGQGPTRTCPSS